MKRVLKIVLLLVIGFNLKTVYAGGIGIAINSVTQNGVPLEYTDNKYIVTNYSEIAIDYELINYDDSLEYTIVLEDKNSSGGGAYNKTYHVQYIPVSNYETEYTLKVCNNYDCEIVYAMQEFEFDYQMYELINNSKLYVERVTQYGNVIGGVKNNSVKETEYTLNKFQTISIELQGHNFKDDVVYVIGEYEEKYEFTGEELNRGVSIIKCPNENDYSYLPIRRKNQDSIITYAETDDGYKFKAVFTEDDSLSDFSYGLEYFDYPDEDIEEVKNNYVYKFYVLNSNLFNSNHALKINYKKDDVDTSLYYPLKVKLTGNGKVYYNDERNVSGDLVKNGNFLLIESIQLDLITKEIWDTIGSYNLYIELDGIGHNIKLLYNSLGKYVTINSKIYYEYGKKSLTTSRGRGINNWGGGFFPTNRGIFNKYSKVYFRYTSNDSFDNDVLYDYTLEYGEYKSLDNLDVAYAGVKQLKSGKIKGSILNTIGAYFEVDNQDNYQLPFYKFTVKKDDELLFSSTPVLEMDDYPSLASVVLKANNRNLFLRRFDDMIDSYVATRNAPINMKISGIGFDDDKNYTIGITYYLYSKGNYLSEDAVIDKQIYREYSVLGKQLNNNMVNVTANDIKIDKKHVFCFAYIGVSGGHAQGGVDIEFVDSKDLLPTVNKYILDNANDLIKKIKKKTTIENFISNFEVANDGKLKIFDNTGQVEVTDNIGTGMLTRIINKFDENVLDLDVVVTGDINGDGNISVTDLAKLERHIAKLNELDGVYELAADVNGNGTVTLTDLTKIVRDIAKLEEIE